MKRRLKALVIAEIPAPYRVDVFVEMSRTIDMDVFFQSNKDQSRNSKYFVNSAKIPFLILDNVSGKNEFNKALKNIREYDMLIAYHPVCKAALRAEWVCKKNHIPYFVNIDGAFVHPNIIKDTIKKWAYRDAVGCFSGGRAATEYFLHYGVKRERIFEYGFTGLHKKDIAKTVCSEKEKSNTRKNLGLNDLRTVIAVGQFIHRKGFDLLLNAWGRIDTSDSQLIIIGGGPERDFYEALMNAHKLKNVMLIDYASKDKIYQYYRASDVFVLPTREDVWGLVINEAMAQGLPILVTDMCNAGTQLIDNGINGYVVPVNVKAIVEKLSILLNSSNLAEMGEHNLKKISEYTVENTAINHIQAINIALF